MIMSSKKGIGEEDLGVNMKKMLDKGVNKMIMLGIIS